MSDRPRYPRSGCVVPFCRRTSSLFKGEWLCGEHWRLVDRGLKHFRTKRLRQIGRLCERYAAETTVVQAALEAGGPEEAVWLPVNKHRRAYKRWLRIARATWRRMKHQAIERAAGASA